MGAYIANTVQDVRVKEDMTQEELAEKVGVSRQTIIAIERGHYTPSVMLAMKIARCFKRTVEDIFSIEREK
jgi:putative transcriptional regulator